MPPTPTTLGWTTSRISRANASRNRRTPHRFSPISDVTISESSFHEVREPMRPEHVSNLRLDDVEINGEHHDETMDR
ncbi:hypothetical protein SAMN04487820_10119 [Actinopolyspora mzabensis]|uniref:Uncharacterized protein n=1 Tax=Actinopolyspora mzabensis TaxID=995066 RepID=A0A1G8VE61_ACTMZ|nr:hypothetical protein SAMN04487820_10119 [Actinopolyspora mzabensis]